MEATHVLFARELSKYLKIQDFKEYYLGTLYPDTRYVTKIDRSLTHALKSPQDPFVEGLTDFEKGWATHILYDRTSSEALRAAVEVSGEEFWISITAGKIIEDMRSHETLGPEISLFEGLAYKVSPNDEPIEELNAFLDYQREIYGEKPEFHHYAAYSQRLGIPAATADRVAELARTFHENEKIRDDILNIYPRVLRIVTRDRT